MLVFVLMMLAAAHAFRPANKAELKAAIQNCIDGHACRVNDDGISDDNGEHISDWVTSDVTDMSLLFSETSFMQPLRWDTSKVTNMSNMFSFTRDFHQPLNWDVSSVTDMSYMFRSSSFNQPLDWDTSKVTDMSYMFYDSDFNQPLNWDVSSVTDMSYMFANTMSFNQPLVWDVSNVTDMSYMFANARGFNQDLSSWNVQSSADINYMFALAMSFRQQLCGSLSRVLPAGYGTGARECCAAGKYAEPGLYYDWSTDNGCADCAAGKSSVAGAMSCNSCEIGQFAAAGESCAMCPTGWGALANSESCVDLSTLLPDFDALCLANNYLSLGNSQHLVQLVDAFDANAMANKLRCGC